MRERVPERWADNLSPVSAVTLKSLRLRRCEIGRHWGTSVVTDLKPNVPSNQGARELLCCVTLLKGTHVVALSGEGTPPSGAGVEVNMNGRWHVSRSINVKKGFCSFLRVGRNQVYAENYSYPLLLWLWQLHNCIIFFCLLQLLLWDGEGKKKKKPQTTGTLYIKCSGEPQVFVTAKVCTAKYREQ